MATNYGVNVTKIDIYKSKRLLVEHAAAIREILQQAVERALLEHKRAGNPVASWEQGRVVLLSPEDIQIPAPDPNRDSA
jgi:hypothetical protein